MALNGKEVKRDQAIWPSIVAYYDNNGSEQLIRLFEECEADGGASSISDLQKDPPPIVDQAKKLIKVLTKAINVLDDLKEAKSKLRDLNASDFGVDQKDFQLLVLDIIVTIAVGDPHKYDCKTRKALNKFFAFAGATIIHEKC
ncbi:hemoglobin subunit alpha-1-like [Eleutherodactylus coqui]|uniref:hemoglobin subunit alpha-1-like n=1 Tax=Eleutherodactylus coqui TaxID=57060 RepID=UPI00346234F1